ncbi:MAG: hypothetical protein KF832_26960 [Caldilineaceae bacterium]|nr:hypothetical protein [Caldilineaceae bacterium]
MGRDKITLALTDSALNYVNANASERKRGEFVSMVLEEYAQMMSSVSELSCDEAGLLERIDLRLTRIEKQLGLLLVERQEKVA